jgi:hypothetical protein
MAIHVVEVVSAGDGLPVHPTGVAITLTPQAKGRLVSVLKVDQGPQLGVVKSRHGSL